jgi:hypothetical protein
MRPTSCCKPFVLEIGFQIHGAADGGAELLGVARLGEELMGGADALENQFLIGVPGQDEAHRFGMPFHDFAEQLGAVHHGHPHIRDDDRHGGFCHESQRGGGVIQERHVPLVAHGAHGALQPL